MEQIEIIKSNKNVDDIICMFDQEEYKQKPSGSEVGKIKNRIENNNFSHYRIETFKEEFIKGKTCIPSGIKGEPNKNFTKTQVFLIDLDNKIEGKETTQEDERHITIDKIKEVCEKKELVPTFIYTTFSHTKEQNRYRLVYVFESPITDYKIARRILINLLEELKELYPDISKKNLSDLFFGGKEIVDASNIFYKIEDIKPEQKEKKGQGTKNEEEQEIEDTETAEQQIVNVEIDGIEYKYKIPKTFFIDENGNIFHEKIKDNKIIEVRISHLPVFITGIMQNKDTGEEKLEIAIRKNGIWKKGMFTKQQVYGSIVELANFGMPVNIGNARTFIRYLAEFEADNQDTIPIIEAVSKIGWRDGYFIPFSKNCPYKMDIDYRLDKWINAYKSKGTLKEWLREMKPFRENVIFRFILASSFSAPLLNILGHRIFIVFNWGNSRAGKTSALRAGLSVWGNAEDLTVTFNTTSVRNRKTSRLFQRFTIRHRRKASK